MGAPAPPPQPAARSTTAPVCPPRCRASSVRALQCKADATRLPLRTAPPPPPRPTHCAANSEPHPPTHVRPRAPSSRRTARRAGRSPARDRDAGFATCEEARTGAPQGAAGAQGRSDRMHRAMVWCARAARPCGCERPDQLNLPGLGGFTCTTPTQCRQRFGAPRASF